MPVQKVQRRPLTAVLALVLIAGFGIKTLTGDQRREEAQRSVLASQLPYYPLRTCVVSGEELQPSSVVIEMREGQLVLLANESAREIFDREPRTYLDLLRQAVIRAQRDSYPRETCLVSGEPLGSMGEVVEHVQDMRLVRLCCPACEPTVEKDPSRYTKELDRAYLEAGRAEAVGQIQRCPVTGAELGPQAVEVMWGTQLLRLADESARRIFLSDPWRYVADSR